MDGPKPQTRSKAGTLPGRFRALVHVLLSEASKGLPRAELLDNSSQALIDFSLCDVAEIYLQEADGVRHHRLGQSPVGEWRNQGEENPERTDAPPLSPGRETIPPHFVEAVLKGEFAAAPPFYTRGGSFWTGDTTRPILLREISMGHESARGIVLGGEYLSIALVPIPIDLKTGGALFLGSRKRDFISVDDVRFYEAAAETLGIALAHHATQWALKERVKELSCLYGIARVLQQPDLSLDILLREIVSLLPPGWQYPEITHSRITLDGRPFESSGFMEGSDRMAANIVINGQHRGSVEVTYAEHRPPDFEGPFLREERSLINAVADTLGMALGHQKTQWKLQERVKELTCLYSIANIARQPGIGLSAALQQIAAVLPPGWQYPAITVARITLDERPFMTPGFRLGPHLQAAAIVVKGVERGVVEIVYTEHRPPAAEGPFLAEERSLIEEVARQVAIIVESQEAQEEKERLQEQLRHADRLATIGQLSAGAAHELNEPLGNILGFAQLAKECPRLPQQAGQDLDKIVTAALHAREVIKKLMLFARQEPPKMSRIDLNALVRDGLYFIESRCLREGIHLIFQLSERMPQVTADPSQIHQVLINLVVNAIQAMPDGGTLAISTHADDKFVYLQIRDTGVGMDPEIAKLIFTPFFTTKGIGQGTGLGLSVVHGILADHGGSVDVKSTLGQGSCFEVRLPTHSGPAGAGGG